MDPSPPSVSRTSARPRCCGTGRAVAPCTMRSFGRTAAPRRFARNGVLPVSGTRSRSAPGSWSIRISRHRRSAGCSTRCLGCASAPPKARSRSARSTAFSCGASPAANCTRRMLPEVHATGGDFGATLPELFGDAIPIAAMAGDQQAALIGQACFRPGMVKSTYGTGAFALLHTGTEPAASGHRLLTTVAYQLGGETAYALEGSIFIAGAAVQWLRDRLGAITAAPQSEMLAARADPR